MNPVLNPALCPDCEQAPCKCAEWQAAMDRMEALEAERASDEAATNLPYLWHEGPDGLLVRRRTQE